MPESGEGNGESVRRSSRGSKTRIIINENQVKRYSSQSEVTNSIENNGNFRNTTSDMSMQKANTQKKLVPLKKRSQVLSFDSNVNYGQQLQNQIDQKFDSDKEIFNYKEPISNIKLKQVNSTRSLDGNITNLNKIKQNHL